MQFQVGYLVNQNVANTNIYIASQALFSGAHFMLQAFELCTVDHHWIRKTKNIWKGKEALAWFIESTFGMSVAPSDIAGKSKKSKEGMSRHVDST